MYTNLFILHIYIIAYFLSIPVLFALWRRRTSVGHNVLLTGLCDAGKTLIYARLMHTKYVRTHTSVKENIGDAPEYNVKFKFIYFQS